MRLMKMRTLLEWTRRSVSKGKKRKAMKREKATLIATRVNQPMKIQGRKKALS